MPVVCFPHPPDLTWLLQMPSAVFFRTGKPLTGPSTLLSFKWRARAAETADCAVNWVKRRAEHDLRLQAPSTLESAAKGLIHPADKVQHHGRLWTPRWLKADTEPNLQDFDSILSSLPARGQSTLDLSPTAEELRKATAKMRSKAPGPDAWTATMLVDSICNPGAAVLRNCAQGKCLSCGSAH